MTDQENAENSPKPLTMREIVLPNLTDGSLSLATPELDDPSNLSEIGTLIAREQVFWLNTV